MVPWTLVLGSKNPKAPRGQNWPHLKHIRQIGSFSHMGVSLNGGIPPKHANKNHHL